MTSQVEIYNLALMNIGQTDTVASLEEKSKARITCSTFWAIARDTMLAEFNWPFATRYVTLALIDEVTSPWLYTYQYPTDCMKAQFFTVIGSLQPDEKLQPEFQAAYGTGGQVILSNLPDAVMAYTVRVDDAGRFPPLFVMALAWKLASLIAMPLTATQSLAQAAAAQYKAAVQDAWAQSLNESKFRYNHDSEYVTVRGA